MRSKCHDKVMANGGFLLKYYNRLCSHENEVTQKISVFQYLYLPWNGCYSLKESPKLSCIHIVKSGDFELNLWKGGLNNTVNYILFVHELENQ